MNVYYAVKINEAATQNEKNEHETMFKEQHRHVTLMYNMHLTHLMNPLVPCIKPNMQITLNRNVILSQDISQNK